MHSEYYHVSKETAEVIEATKKAGKRVIAVGTTSIRTLETVARDHDGHIVPTSGWTDIFISPGYEFRVVDAFVTNCVLRTRIYARSLPTCHRRTLSFL